MDTTRGTKRSYEEDADDTDDDEAVGTEAEQEGFAGLPDDILRRIMTCGDFADRSRLRCCCRSLKRAERELPPPDWVVVSVFESKAVKQNSEALQPRGSKPGDSIIRIEIVRDRAVLRLSGIRPIKLEVHFIGWGHGDTNNHAANITNAILKRASEQVRVLFLKGITMEIDITDGLSPLRRTLEAMRVETRLPIYGWQSGALFRSMYSLSGLKHLTGMRVETNVGDFAALLERLPNLEHFETLVDPTGTSWLPFWKRIKENGGCMNLRSLSTRIRFDDLESFASTVRDHFPSLQRLSIDYRYSDDHVINASKEQVAVLKKFDFLSGLSIPLYFDPDNDEDNGTGGAHKPLVSALRALPNLRDGLILVDPSECMWSSIHKMGGHKLRGIEICCGRENMEATVNGLIGALPALECVRFEQHLDCNSFVDGEAAVASHYEKNAHTLLLLKQHPTLRCIILDQFGAGSDGNDERSPRIASLRFISEMLPSICVIDGKKAMKFSDYLQQ